ncbi:BlaI/MecI/CopY family transcriptional regulator [Rapidithrix thailandica]|uniref:BlaI/MecI/CopY family transcriptional regulator n=1 Tax=Rapidithrix thailandica TaxID=413964 RepID=A0AAW9RYQ0_9BACT
MADLPKPTEAELEILQILWEKEPCTVRQVNEVLSQKKKTGYTTTLKFMQIMLEKGLLKREEAGRSHIYSSAVAEADTQQRLLDRFVNQVFKGSASKLVMQALGNKKSSKDELEQIRKLLDEIDNADNE